MHRHEEGVPDATAVAWVEWVRRIAPNVFFNDDVETFKPLLCAQIDIVDFAFNVAIGIVLEVEGPNPVTDLGNVLVLQHGGCPFGVVRSCRPEVSD